MRTLSLPLCCLALLALLFAGLPVHAAYHRWAVITSGGPEEARFSDLLLAELTTVPDLELVERAELEKLAHEQVLSGALSAEGSADRLKIGRILRADALVLTKISGPAENRELQLIVAECTCGARLHVEILPWSMENLPALVRYAAGLVGDVRKRFANGITCVYGVPSFVSQSLSREYDPLQARYAQLIAGALSLQPGTAVIETEEARALGRELALGNDPELKRLVPAFVAGEFRVEPRPGKEELISLKVSVTGGTKTPVALNSEAMPLSDAGKWLATTVVPKILATAGNAQPLTVEIQAAALSTRAEIFSQLGAPEEANGLREAALLLTPEATALRMNVVRDYCRMAQYDPSCTFPGLPKTDDAQKLDFINRRVTAYEAALDHAVQLIAAGVVPEADVLVMFDTLKEARYSFEQSWNDFGTYVVRTPAAKQRVSETSLDTLRFYDQVASLMIPRMDARQFWLLWMPKLDRLMEMLPALYTPTDYEAYYQFNLHLLELLPDGLDYVISPRFFWSAPEEPLQAYCKALAVHPKGIARLQADFITICRRLKPLNNKAGRNPLNAQELTEAAELEQGMEKLIAAYQALVFPDPAQMPTRTRGLSTLKSYQQITARLRKTYTASPGGTAQPPARTFGAVSLQKLELKIIDGPAIKDPRELKVDVYPCTDTLEFVKTSYHLYLHQRPGELRHLIGITGPSAQKQFADLAWDGDRLWAAVNTEGLWVLAPDGQLLGKVTKEDGLPEADAMLLQSLGDGRVFAVGSFGEERRAWCAILQWKKDDRPAVKIVYEARRSLSPTDPFENPASLLDPAVGFQPLSVTPVTNAAGHPALLIGRYHQNCTTHATGKWAFLRPLLLDLQTFQAIVPDLIDIAGDPHRSALAAGDTVYLFGKPDPAKPPRPVKVDFRAGEGGAKPTCQPVPLDNPGTANPDDLFNPPDFASFVGNPGIEARVLLSGPDGWVYVHGVQWWRFNPKTGRGQRLTGPIPDGGFIGGRLLRSNLLGLILWCYDGVYKVVIDETKIPKSGE